MLVDQLFEGHQILGEQGIGLGALQIGDDLVAHILQRRHFGALFLDHLEQVYAGVGNYRFGDVAHVHVGQRLVQGVRQGTLTDPAQVTAAARGGGVVGIFPRHLGEAAALLQRLARLAGPLHGGVFVTLVVDADQHVGHFPAGGGAVTHLLACFVFGADLLVGDLHAIPVALRGQLDIAHAQLFGAHELGRVLVVEIRHFLIGNLGIATQAVHAEAHIANVAALFTQAALLGELTFQGEIGGRERVAVLLADALLAQRFQIALRGHALGAHHALELGFRKATVLVEHVVIADQHGRLGVAERHVRVARGGDHQLLVHDSLQHHLRANKRIEH